MADKQVTSINGMGSISETGGVFTTKGMEANDHMHLSEDFIQNSGIVQSGDMEVTQAATPGKKVLVQGGVVYVENSDYTDLSLSEQRYWRVKINGEEEVTVSDNTSGNPRIDIVCVKVDPTATPDDEATNVATLVMVEGTPAASPTAPAIPDDHEQLAEVEVANGFTSIVNTDITDSRNIVEMSDHSIYDGWEKSGEVWTYKSTLEIYVTGDVTSKYTKGDKIKFSNPTVKYMYVVGVGSYDSGNNRTTLTVTGGSDYAVANTSIDNNYLSKVSSPYGFPCSFNYTATWSGSGSLSFSPGGRVETFSIIGCAVYFSLFNTGGTTSGTEDLSITASLPVTPVEQISGGCSVRDSTTTNYVPGWFEIGGDDLVHFYKNTYVNWGIGSGRFARVQGFYIY